MQSEACAALVPSSQLERAPPDLAVSKIISPSSFWCIPGDSERPNVLPSLAKMWGANLREGTLQSLLVIGSFIPLRGSLRDWQKSHNRVPALP